MLCCFSIAVLYRYPADASCVSMSPDVSVDWKTEESMPFGRSMGNFILLPNGKVFLVNGANTGVAGYGNESWGMLSLIYA